MYRTSIDFIKIQNSVNFSKTDNSYESNLPAPVNWFRTISIVNVRPQHYIRIATNYLTITINETNRRCRTSYRNSQTAETILKTIHGRGEV